MPVTAIVSDIHSNLAALTAVMKDIAENKADEIVCLGDVIGYGPQPLPCVDLARKEFKFTILGNHEEAVLYGAVGFNPKAKAAVDWTRDQFHLESEEEDDRNARWQFLGDMPISVDEDSGVQFVHGSPRDPTGSTVPDRRPQPREDLRDLRARREDRLQRPHPRARRHDRERLVQAAG